MSLLLIDQDHYNPAVFYAPGKHRFTRAEIGTRYLALAVRTFLDPNDPADVAAARAAQDALRIEQPGGPGVWAAPQWDKTSQEALRKASAPPPARAIKPLPLPEDFKPKTTKRGGKRARMWKEKYGVTEAQKRANRIAFGEGTGDVGEESRGMLDVETGGGRIRKTKIKESRILSQAAAKMYTGNSSDSAVVSLALSQGGIHLAAAPIAPRPVAKRDLFGNHVGFGGQNN
jgi:hypothetical protein